MKVIIIGGSGTLGKKITAELSKRHEVIVAGRKSGTVRVDIDSAASIEQMFTQAGKFDAIVCAAGGGYFGPLQTMTEENVYASIRSKLMGQVNVVLIGQKYINDSGSFTLTSGVLADDPVRNSTAVALVNGALNSFVLGAAQELLRGIRINIVSPGIVEDSVAQMGAWFPGHTPVPMNRVVDGYVKSVEGIVNGKVITVY